MTAPGRSDAPAGWYRDPQVATIERWWTGEGWGEQTRTPAVHARQHRDTGIGGCLAVLAALAYLIVCFALRPVAGILIGWEPLALVLYLDWKHR